MARRYGAKVKTERTWKKISRMNMSQLEEFKKHLEKHNQYYSDVYNTVTKRMSVLSSY